MRVLLDTCTVSHLARRHPAALAWFERETPDSVAVSTVTVHEIEHGLRARPSAERRVGGFVRGLLRSVHRLPFDEVAAVRAAEVRAALRVAGRPVGPYDLLIAATALGNELVLATSNVRELSVVPGLVLEDWTGELR